MRHFHHRIAVEFALVLGVLAVVAGLPLAITNPYWLGVIIVSMYFALLASGWNLLAGYTGQFSLAPACFAMIGAYCAAVVRHRRGDGRRRRGRVAVGAHCVALARAVFGAHHIVVCRGYPRCHR